MQIWKTGMLATLPIALASLAMWTVNKPSLPSSPTRIPSLKSAIIQAIQISSSYKVLRRGTGASRIAASKQPDASIRVRFLESNEYFDVHQRPHKKSAELFVVSFSSSGIKKRAIGNVTKLVGPAANANTRLCKAVSVAYSSYNPMYGKQTSFDVEAQEKAHDEL